MRETMDDVEVESTTTKGLTFGLRRRLAVGSTNG